MSKKFTGITSAGSAIPVYDKDAHSALQNKADVSALTAYQEKSAMTAYQPVGDYYSASNPSGFLTAVPADMATTGDIADLAQSISETYQPKGDYQPSGDYYSASNPSGFITGVDLTPYQEKSGMSAYQPVGEYYSASNPSGFITGVDLTPYQEKSAMSAYQTVEGMSAYQPSGDYQIAGDYLSASESANFYPMTGNPSGFLTEHQSLDGLMQTSGLEYDGDKISGYMGSAFKAGDELPSGVMVESGLGFNAVNEISGYNGSAIAQYGAEKQWLVHDDTLVHAANSAQYALGVNVSAVQTLMGLNQPNQWIDVKSEVNYNSNAIAAGGFNIVYNPFLKMVNLTCDVQVKAGSEATSFMTWSERLKPATDVQFALGNGIYVSSGQLFQGSYATQRWINDCWCWGVKGE